MMPATMTSGTGYSPPVHRPDRLLRILGKVEEELDDAHFVVAELKKQLMVVEDEIDAEEKKGALASRRHKRDLHYTMFDYLTNNKAYFTDTLGDLQTDLVETDRRVDDYELKGQLGDGFHATVHLGLHHGTRKQYALKKISKTRLANIKTMTQFEKELKALKVGRHRNVVQFVRLIHAPTSIYLVMELGYKDLYRYLDEFDTIPAESVREVAIGVLLGLEYLHENGIAHMDIKPENILVTSKVDIHNLRRRHIQICDLGLCFIAPKSNEPVRINRVIGTVGFIAPEVVCSRKTADGRVADMWSLGCTLMSIVDDGLTHQWDLAYKLYNKDQPAFIRALSNCLIDFYNRKNYVDVQMHRFICRCLVISQSERITVEGGIYHPWIQGMVDEQTLLNKSQSRHSVAF